MSAVAPEPMGNPTDGCWADPLSRPERHELAARLARACKGLHSGSHFSASAEMSDLHVDVTERAAYVPPGADRWLCDGPADEQAAATGYRGELLAAAVAEARAEVARTDAKAGVLLTLATAALAGLVTLARAGHRGAAGPVLLWLAAAACAGAVVVLLTAVRPRFVDTPRGMLADHAALLAAPAGGLAAWQERRLRLLSALAVAKHRRVRRAVDLLLTGLLLLAAAAPLVLAGP